MRHLNKVLLSGALALAAACALAQPNVRPAGPQLKVGDGAPPIEVAKWVKGTPVDSLDKGNIYVVEFWATWCGPCKVSIPHLTDMRKKYGDQATFIGVSSFENDWSKVEPFVQSEGDQMIYDVAMDKVDNPGDREGFMAKNWMDAANQNGIPTAFIVDKEGKIAWIGHPMNLEDPLKQVIAGTWDRKMAAKQFAEQMAAQDKPQAPQNPDLQKAEMQFGKDFKAKQYPDALNDLDKIATLDPKLTDQVNTLRLQIYGATGDSDKFNPLAGKMVDLAFNAKPANETAKMTVALNLNTVAWYIVDPQSKFTHRDVKLAMKAASHAVDLTDRKQAAMLDTLAWCYYWKGDKAKAIDLETEATSKIGQGDNPADYKMSMDTFKK